MCFVLVMGTSRICSLSSFPPPECTLSLPCCLVIRAYGCHLQPLGLSSVSNVHFPSASDRQLGSGELGAKPVSGFSFPLGAGSSAAPGSLQPISPLCGVCMAVGHQGEWQEARREP